MREAGPRVKRYRATHPNALRRNLRLTADDEERGACRRAGLERLGEGAEARVGWMREAERIGCGVEVRVGIPHPIGGVLVAHDPLAFSAASTSQAASMASRCARATGRSVGE
jgi:hypothetical protein